MKFVVKISVPEFVTIEASDEQQAIEIVKNNIQDARIRDYAEIVACKEVVLEE